MFILFAYFRIYIFIWHETYWEIINNTLGVIFHFVLNSIYLSKQYTFTITIFALHISTYVSLFGCCDVYIFLIQHNYDTHHIIIFNPPPHFQWALMLCYIDCFSEWHHHDLQIIQALRLKLHNDIDLSQFTDVLNNLVNKISFLAKIITRLLTNSSISFISFKINIVLILLVILLIVICRHTY